MNNEPLTQDQIDSLLTTPTIIHPTPKPMIGRLRHYNANKPSDGALKKYKALDRVLTEECFNEDEEEKIRAMLDKIWLELSDADREHLNNRQADDF